MADPAPATTTNDPAVLKSGSKTTEWFATVIAMLAPFAVPLISAALAKFGVTVDPTAGTIVVGGAAGTWIFSRSIVKAAFHFGAGSGS